MNEHPNSKQQNSTIETELSRDLGLTSALAIGVGTMIAAGIFTLSGLAIRNVGSAAILSFGLAAVVALFTALTYCEFVSIYPRTGEGYLYARKTYNAPLAYFVGWALFLGYTSSCAFYIASLSSYFNEFIWHSPIEALSGILLLIVLTLLNIKGTKESGRFQIWVTAAKVLLLIWFVAGGLRYVQPQEVIDQFSTDFVQIGTTAALVFITFFGFSAIAASAGEVKNPVKTIPRAIFISMGVVTLLYTLVVLVVLFAGLTEYTEASMGEAAKKFLGSIGGYVIIAGAIFSMLSASNASIMAGSRVVLSMSSLGHLPKEISVINANTRTPIIAVMLVGGMILIFALILPLEDLSYFANTVLLLALILVNAALIIHRRKYPDMERPFKVPFVPLLPILGILANIYLISQIFAHPIPLLLAISALLLGMIAFITWKGTQPSAEAIPGVATHIAHSQGRATYKKERFRILLPIANPETVSPLLNMATAIAAVNEGEILLLRVVTVPEQLPPTSYDESVIEQERPVLQQARTLAEDQGIPTQAVIRVGHSVAKAILETAEQYNCDLTILGWKGYSSKGEKVFGAITDDIIKNARTDLILAKMTSNAPIQNILLPTAGGAHALYAEQYAAALAKDKAGSITVCKVIGEDLDEMDTQSKESELRLAENRLKEYRDVKVNSELVRSDSITQGIISAGDEYDAIIMGATRKGFYPQLMFGNIPEQIAKNTDKTVIIVKHYNPVEALLGRVMQE